MDKETIAETAALWVLRIEEGGLGSDQKQEFYDWIAANPLHLQELKNKAQIWSDLSDPAIFSDLKYAPDESPRDRHSSASSRWFPGYGLAASILMICLGLMLVLGNIDYQSTSQPTMATHKTAKGQQSRIVLEDGSVMILNTQSKAKVVYSSEERAIHLDSGEGYFKPLKNPARPFVVYAGGGQVEAVGTMFNVRLKGGMVSVLVSEGEVIVAASSHRGHEKTGRVQLRENGTVQYAERIGTSAYLTPEEASKKLAWTSGKLVFDGETLSEVIEEVNRYSADRIEISDPAISELRVGGYFNLGEVNPFLKTLEHGFDIRVERKGGGKIELSRNPN